MNILLQYFLTFSKYHVNLLNVNFRKNNYYPGVNILILK